MKFYIVYEEGSGKVTAFCLTEEDGQRYINTLPGFRNPDLRVRVGTPDDLTPFVEVSV
jgi:hypothetical protein